MIDHRSLELNFLLGALSHRELARAENVKARAAYNEFLDLWKDVDPDIPIVKEARVEAAKLQ